MPSCAVKWCGNHTAAFKKSTGVSFHSFPKNIVQRKKWRKAVRIERAECDWRESYHSKICSLHFTSDDFIVLSENGNRLLRKTAVPICTMSAAFYSPDVEIPQKEYQEEETLRLRRVPKEKVVKPPREKKKKEPKPPRPKKPKAPRKVQKKIEKKDENAVQNACENNGGNASHVIENGVRCGTCNKLFDPNIEEQAKDIVANVYRYLIFEYREFVKKYGGNVDLTPYKRFKERVAEATGLSLYNIDTILREQKEKGVYHTLNYLKQQFFSTDSENEASSDAESEGYCNHCQCHHPNLLLDEQQNTEAGTQDQNVAYEVQNQMEHQPVPELEPQQEQQLEPQQEQELEPQPEPEQPEILTTDIESMPVVVEYDMNANNLIMGNEPPPLAVNVIMSEEEYYNNIASQEDQCTGDNNEVFMDNENAEIEYHHNIASQEDQCTGDNNEVFMDNENAEMEYQHNIASQEDQCTGDNNEVYMDNENAEIEYQHNIASQEDQCTGDNNEVFMDNENAEMEYQQDTEQQSTMITRSTSTEPEPLDADEQLYCGMDTMNTVIGQPNITAQPLMTTDQLYCGLAPTIAANITIGQPMEAQPLMAMEAQHLMPIEAPHLMSMEAQQFMPMEAQHLIPIEAQQLVPMETAQMMPMEAQQFVPIEAQQLIPQPQPIITAEAQFIAAPTGAYTDLCSIQGLNFAPAPNYYVIM